MDWKEKLAEAQKLFDKAQAILGNPESTAEEKSHLQEILEDARQLKADALEHRDVLQEAQELVTAQNEIEKKEQDKQQPVGEFKDWGEFLEASWYATVEGIRDPRLKYVKDEEGEGPQRKSMTGAVGSSGGFLIPAQFLPQLQAVQAEESLVRRAGATVIRMASRQVGLPVLDQTGTTAGQPHWFGGMTFYWAEEGEEKTETEASFRKINLVAKKLIGLTNASDELLDDSAISLGDFLSGPMGFAGGLAWMEDYAFFRGVGGGQPRGIVNAPATLAITRQTTGQIGYVDVINMYSNFLPSSRGAWFIQHSAMASIIQMTGPSGNASYVWQPNARDGTPGVLFGMPVYWTEKLPVLGNRGDILLADMRYYLVGDRQQTTIEATKYHRWVYDETSWRAVHRVDGQPWLSAPITYQDGSTQASPFVVLSTPAS